MNRASSGTTVAFLASLGLFVFGVYLPIPRLWAFSMLDYYPHWIGAVVFLVGLAYCVVLLLTKGGESEPVAPPGQRPYLVATSLITLAMIGLFIIARTRTHFLGDGYTVLSLLASEKPLIKGREIGEAMAHLWLSNVLGGPTKSAALLSYRLISIGAGALFVLGTFLTAGQLFENLRDRLAFAFGMFTAGFFLLFFGYVENYSLFVLAVAAFIYVGLLATGAKISRWYILIPLAAAITFHVLGVTLVPPAIFLLLSGTRFGRRVARARPATWLALVFITVTVGSAALYYLMQADIFIQLAVLPPFANRFTVDNYTLFSIHHLLDFANLVFLLLPGFLVIATSVLPFRRDEYDDRSGVVFLAIASLSTLGAVFLFDPKLGMTRDWDLFAFAGVAPAALGYFLLLRRNPGGVPVRPAAWLAIGLGAIVLAARVGIVDDPPRAIAYFEDIITRDHGRNRTSQRVLYDYYIAQDDSLRAEAAKDRWSAQYPIRMSYDSAYQYFNAGRCDLAMPILHRVLKDYPNYTGAWATACACYTNRQDYDSALFYCRVARGMNPYDASILNNLGLVYFYTDRKGDGLRLMEQAYKLGGAHLQVTFNLAHMRYDSGDKAGYERLLREAATLPGSPPRMALELTKYLMVTNHPKEAAVALKLAVEHGLEAEKVRALIDQVPQFAPYVREYPQIDSMLTDSASSP